MSNFSKMIGLVVNKATIVGNISIIVVMLIIVANVILRFFGGLVQGYYEIVSLLMVISIAFAIGYTAINHGHITVNILIGRIPKKYSTLLNILTLVISICGWGAIAWASILVTSDKGLTEVSNMLLIPYLPFRCIWIIGLIIFVLVLINDLVQLIKRKE